MARHCNEIKIKRSSESETTIALQNENNGLLAFYAEPAFDPDGLRFTTKISSWH